MYRPRLRLYLGAAVSDRTFFNHVGVNMFGHLPLHPMVCRSTTCGQWLLNAILKLLVYFSLLLGSAASASVQSYDFRPGHSSLKVPL